MSRVTQMSLSRNYDSSSLRMRVDALQWKIRKRISHLHRRSRNEDQRNKNTVAGSFSHDSVHDVTKEEACTKQSVARCTRLCFDFALIGTYVRNCCSCLFYYKNDD